MLYFSVLEWPIVVIRAGFPSSQYLKDLEQMIYLFEMAIDVHSGTVSMTGLLVHPPGLTCRPKMGPEKGFSLLPLPLPLLATPGMVVEHVSVSMIGLLFHHHPPGSVGPKVRSAASNKFFKIMGPKSQNVLSGMMFENVSVSMTRRQDLHRN